ncbi:MAG: DUF502 domain-containing protein [Thermoanaerobaculia bacterium]
MKFLIKNFLRGLAILIPIVATIWLVVITFLTIDRWIEAPYPGVGIGVTVLLILAVGMLAGNVIGKKLLGLTEMIFMRAPLVKIIYLAIKDLVEAFVGDRKKFNRPVLVSLPAIEASALGFVTRDRIDFLPGSDLIAVYFPQSYNFAGNLLLVSAARITPIDADSTQVMAFIVSGGISGGAQSEEISTTPRVPSGS